MVLSLQDFFFVSAALPLCPLGYKHAAGANLVPVFQEQNLEHFHFYMYIFKFLIFVP